MNNGFITSIKYNKKRLPQLSKNGTQIKVNHNNNSAFDSSHLPLNNIYNASLLNMNSQNQLPIKQLECYKKSKENNEIRSKNIKQAIEDKMLMDYFKNKCFEDFDIKLHNKDFIFTSNILQNDERKIKSQLLFIKKRAGFWNAFCKFVNPKLAAHHFDQMRSRYPKHKTPIELAIESQLIKSKSQKNLYSNSKSVKRIFHPNSSDIKEQSLSPWGKLYYMSPKKLF